MARFCLKIRKGLTTIWGGAIGRAEADMASAKSRAEEVQALIAQRQVDLALAGDEFSRAQNLAERGVTSQAVADQQETRQASMQAALNAAAARVRLDSIPICN